MNGKRNSLSLILKSHSVGLLSARLAFCSLKGLGFGFPNCFPQVTERRVLISKALIRVPVPHGFDIVLHQYWSVESLDSHSQLLSIVCPEPIISPSHVVASHPNAKKVPRAKFVRFVSKALRKRSVRPRAKVIRIGSCERGRLRILGSRGLILSRYVAKRSGKFALESVALTSMGL